MLPRSWRPPGANGRGGDCLAGTLDRERREGAEAAGRTSSALFGFRRLLRCCGRRPRGDGFAVSHRLPDGTVKWVAPGLDAAMRARCGWWCGSAADKATDRTGFRFVDARAADASEAICWRSDLEAQPVSLLCARSALRTGWARSLPSQKPGGFRLRSRRRGCSWGRA